MTLRLREHICSFVMASGLCGFGVFFYSKDVFSCILLLKVFWSAFVEYLGGLSLLSPLAQLKDVKGMLGFFCFVFNTQFKKGLQRSSGPYSSFYV